MPNKRKAVLIFAQSGRFLAQSATQAGYRVWVADCFGDQDTISSCERWQQLPPFAQLSLDDILATFNQLTQGEHCLLICGSGIEAAFSILDKLPDHIQLIGNSFNTIRTIKTAPLFFAALAKLNLPFPDTLFEPPKVSSTWLVKSASGLGGNHIHYLDNITPSQEHYFQRFITGKYGSVLFSANNSYAQLISINQQFLSSSEKTPFRLGKIETPWQIPTVHIKHLQFAINKLSSELGLMGINSLDFVISDHDELMLLEINPRLSASAELTDNKAGLFTLHINACLNQTEASPQCELTNNKVSLKYIYAPHKVTVPVEMKWPTQCHDLPVSGTLIHKGTPICTSIVHFDEGQQSDSLHTSVEQRIFSQLLLSA